jgi:hypothetical protein
MNTESQNPKSEIRNPNSAVDNLLGSFFRSEMPQPWPECFAQSRMEEKGWRIEDGRSKMESRTNDSERGILNPRPSILNPRSSSRSRWVLAASLIFLLIGSWWLGQRFSTAEPAMSPNSSGKMIGSKAQPGKSKPPRHLSKSVVPQNR